MENVPILKLNFHVFLGDQVAVEEESLVFWLNFHFSEDFFFYEIDVGETRESEHNGSFGAVPDINGGIFFWLWLSSGWSSFGLQHKFVLIIF